MAMEEAGPGRKLAGWVEACQKWIEGLRGRVQVAGLSEGLKARLVITCVEVPLVRERWSLKARAKGAQKGCHYARL